MSGPAGPNFFLLGAHKSGTTSLFDDLIRHPEVYSSPVKETFFFVREDRYALGPEHYEETYFSGAEGFSARGEATPRYLYCGRKVAPRIKGYVGAGPCRMLAILRHPVARAWSHYCYSRRGQADQPAFLDAIRGELAVGGGEPDPGYVWRGRYASHLKDYLALFPRQDFMVLLTEDYTLKRQETLARIFGFLGVDPHVPIREASPKNVGGTPRSRALRKLLDGRESPLAPLVKRLLPSPWRRQAANALRRANTRAFSTRPKPTVEAVNLLLEVFAPEVSEMEEILGRDLSAWRRSPYPTEGGSSSH